MHALGQLHGERDDTTDAHSDAKWVRHRVGDVCKSYALGLGKVCNAEEVLGEKGI